MPCQLMIPKIEWSFWVDQKTPRKISIEKNNSLVTDKLKLLNRKSKVKKFLVKELERSLLNVFSEDFDMIIVQKTKILVRTKLMTCAR